MADDRNAERILESGRDDIFEDVFGNDAEEKEAKERVLRMKEERESKAKAKKELEEEQESEEEEKDAEESTRLEEEKEEKIEEHEKSEKPAKQKRKAKALPEKKELHSKIKKVIMAKAEKAAAKEANSIDKEAGIKETGVKEPEPEESEEDSELAEEKEDNAGLKIKPKLDFLSDSEGNVFIGRKNSVFKKYGNEAGLLIGNIAEEDFNSKRVLLDGLNPHVVFVCGARGSGKCLTGDTLITLENGLVVPIEELDKTEGKIFGLQHSLKIEPLHREGFFKRKVERILKIRLRSGKEIKLTPEHPLLTVEGWKPAEDLLIGSRIATPRILPAFGNSVARDCEVKLMAYLLAEGHLGNNFVLFSNSDTEIQRDFFESVFLFDSNLKILPHGRVGYRVSQKKRKVDISCIIRNESGQFSAGGYIVLKKSSLADWLISLGIYGKKSAEKFIPKEIMQLKKEQLALFLNRLFSCDGSIYRINKGKNWCIDYCSSSKKLVGQVQNLLLRFGILCTLRQKSIKTNGKRFISFEIVVYGENACKFINEIGFFGCKEKKQEIAFSEMMEVSRNPNTDTVPKEIWKDFKVSNWAEAGRQLGYSSPKSLHSTVTYAPSREKLLRLAQIEQNIGIQILVEADVFWDEITEKTELNGEFEVFDISVPIHHNFVANDIIVHNSYLLGVLAEEIAWHNPNVGIIVIDPIGVFWGMRYPNKDERELELLAKAELLPKGLENLKVFIPEGIKNQVPKNTFDACFSVPPNLLTAEDWCLTFGIERFSPTGLLLEKTLSKVKTGFKTKDGKYVKANPDYDLNDLIDCLHLDSEINSPELGYKSDSIRALASRFDAAKAWGILDKKGTPLAELSVENQLTIIDTSFLDDNVSALVIGLLARRILAARKISTRKESASRFKEQNISQLLEFGIPPTWLFIDEAHTLIPSGNVRTPASNALIEYVKQGRQPGCSLVFATQQPSAIDTRVLSQLDIIVSHKLVFDDDIKAVYKRTPAIIPRQYKSSNFIKTLPIGVALVGDRREETTRAFIMKIRPRMSQHEGRDAVTSERSAQDFDREKVKALAVGMAFSKIEKEPIESSVVSQIVQMLNTKYKSDVQLSEVLDELEAKGVVINPKNAMLSLQGEEAEQEIAEELVEEVEKEVQKEAKKILPEENIALTAFPINLAEEPARKIFDKLRQKKKLGLFGKEESIEKIVLKYIPVYHVRFNVFKDKHSFHIAEAYINSLSGEFLNFDFGKKEFVESKGLDLLSDFSMNESRALLLLSSGKYSLDELAQKLGENKAKIEPIIESLRIKELVDAEQAKEKELFFSKKELDLPKNPLHSMLTSLNKLPVSEVTVENLEKPRFDKAKLQDVFSKIWGKVQLRSVSDIFLPVYEAIIKKHSGDFRIIMIDAFSGKELRI